MAARPVAVRPVAVRPLVPPSLAADSRRVARPVAVRPLADPSLAADNRRVAARLAAACPEAARPVVAAHRDRRAAPAESVAGSRGLRAGHTHTRRSARAVSEGDRV